MRFALIVGALAATAIAGHPACLKHKKKHCHTPHGKGLCMDVRDCKGKGTSMPGYCPGGVNFQCCVKDEGDHSSSSAYPMSSAYPTSAEATSAYPTSAAATSAYPSSAAPTYSTGGSESSKSHHSKSSHQSKPTKATTMKTHTSKATSDKPKPTSDKPKPTSDKPKSTTSAKPKPSDKPKPKDGGGHVDDSGLHLIESEEGWRADFYTINGDKTIGYGHDCTQKGDCASIHAPLSKAEGQALLAKDVHGFESCVCKLPHAAKLNQNQFNALVSFAYNSGCGGVSNYFRSYMSRSDFSGICSALPHTNTLGGQLSSRRAREGAMCKGSTEVMSGC